jgi:hypothetical protein|tara:strand:+ start:240608 stop:240850 length:243 start_codon:yes stop_codon:yes gene_type:complete
MNTQKTQANGMTLSTMMLAGVLAIGTAAIAVTNRKKLAQATTSVKDKITDALGDAALAMDPTFRPTETTTQPNNSGVHGH